MILIKTKILTLILIGGQFQYGLADINRFAQNKTDTLKTITVIDYETNEPLLGGSILIENKEITRADRNGTFLINWDKNANISLEFVGFERVEVKTSDLLKTDSVFLFGQVLKSKYLKTKHYNRAIFKKSQYIVRNQIIIQRNNVTYNYEYFRKGKKLKLRIINAR